MELGGAVGGEGKVSSALSSLNSFLQVGPGAEFW